MCGAPCGARDRHFSRPRCLRLRDLRVLRRGAAYPRLSDGPPSRLFCLAPDWVFRAAGLAARRGRLLPYLFTITAHNAFQHRARLFVFCDTFRQRGMWPALPRLERKRARRMRARPCGHARCPIGATTFLAGNPALWCPDFPLEAAKNLERRSGPKAKAATTPESPAHDNVSLLA